MSNYRFANALRAGSINFAGRLAGVLVAALISTASMAGENRGEDTASDSSIGAGMEKVIVRGEKIVDAEGRARYIVDLVETPMTKRAPVGDVQAARNLRMAHIEQAVRDLAGAYGVEIHSMTKAISITFSAYLTEKQVMRLAKDPRVLLITRDTSVKPSSVWTDATDASGQVRPWGLQAMGAAGGQSSGTATVYVVDYGVDAHNDLTGLAAIDRISVNPGINPTGCYAHGTHVAGIIGAADNGFGVVGVNPGAKLVSIGMGEVNVGGCGQPAYGIGPNINTWTAALDMVYDRIATSGHVSVVNISFNGSGIFSANQTLGLKIKRIATPTSSYIGVYPGGLVVQSAGNDNSTDDAMHPNGGACDVAYDSPNAADGILVVGAIDDNGQRIQDKNGVPGSIGMPNANDDSGSNYGRCVEVWAPGQQILSTWNGGGYVKISGTSMAAPHIAGMAARILESNGAITNSIDLETAVRAQLVTINGSGLGLPRFGGAAVTAAPTVEIDMVYATSPVTYQRSPNVNFNEFPEAVNSGFRYQAVGANSCYAYAYAYYQGTNVYVWGQPVPTSGSLGVGWGGGTYQWTVTCSSAQGTSSSATATGHIKRHVTAQWFASTTSTGYNMQLIDNGGVIHWSVSLNAPFDQISNGVGADYCQVWSYGFIGNYAADPDNPQRNPYAIGGFAATLLWASDWYYFQNYPAYVPYATFYYGDPLTAPPPLGSYNGYKWVLTCTNADGASDTKIMYGTPSL